MMKINQCVMNVVKKFKVEAFTGIPEGVKDDIRKELMEVIQLIRVFEQDIKTEYKEIFFIGKVMGRVEGVYSLIAKGVKDE